ncbi:MAG: adenylate/guanylate cyclase domain-containing protein, partial [Saprospiraceae bacterium]
LTDARINEQILLATQQRQDLALKQNAVDLANKERALQRLEYLKTQADLQSSQSQNKIKEEALARVQKEKELQTAQVSLQKTQLSLQERALQSQKNQRQFYIAAMLLLALLSFFIYRNFRNQQKSNAIIRVEKQKADDLLRNILPNEVAEELKNKGEAPARQYEAVTVLFTDFVNFTQISERLSASQLVGALHEYFRAFDEISERYGLEKIKTIGDAYMAVAGLPVPDREHGRRAALAALDMLAFIRHKQQSDPAGFEIRIGLHSGPVVAGIVGAKKFAFDIWGDTVNTAARMESGSEPGKINISSATHQLIEADFVCAYRGKQPVKNKGAIEMFFLEKIRDSAEF